MNDLKALFMDLMLDRKKRLYLIGGAALALLLVAMLLITILGGSGRKYNRYYNEAEAAYLAGDYASAEDKLRRAMDLKSTEKAYLLMADIYCAQGETDRAIQVLYLGYSHLGGSKIEKRLEELKGGKGSTAPLPPTQQNVTIGGKTMDGSVTSLVLTGTRLKSDDLTALSTLARMENLGISDCGITDISFLSDLTGMTFLQISDNRVKDLTPLAGMKYLKTLYIDNNPITDLTPLYGLSSLRTLSMKGIEVSRSQLEALREALPNCSIYADEPDDSEHEITIGGRTFRTDATELNLGGLGISDISAITACTRLEKLDLRDNKIADISPLVELPNLKWLCIWNNEVEDINPLLSLANMEFLDADGNRISDISVLEYLPRLREVWLNRNPLKSIAPLCALSELRRLGLAGTDLSDGDLDLLMSLSALEELNIKDNRSISAGKLDALKEALPNCEITHDDILRSIRFGDLEFFADAKQISAVSMDIFDLTGLEEFKELEILDLDGNHISDLSPLRDLPSLTELRLGGSSVSDLSPLSGLKTLKVLNLRDNSIRTLTPLVGCTGLQELNLRGNGLSDLSPLAYLTGLTTLDVSDNQIRDLSALYSLTSLRSLDLRGNPLNDDDIRALKTALPNCTVLFGTDPAETPVPTADPPRPASGTDLF